jgi:hypothetical protein
MLSFKYGTAVQSINALTLFAAIDTQATPFGLSKEPRLFDARPTVWTLQTARVKVFQHPGRADVLIEEVNDWEIHGAIIADPLYPLHFFWT